MAKKTAPKRTTRSLPSISYYSHYVEDCAPRFKKFKTEKALNQFINAFKFSEDNWIDFTFKGSVLQTFDYYQRFRK